MKQRLLIMNGQRIVQSEKGGEWANQKVEKAGALKPGIYNLYMAREPEKTQAHAGTIVHVDNSHVYQQIGRNFVMHARSDFDKVPEIGSAKSISYSVEGNAVVAAEAPKLARSRSR